MFSTMTTDASTRSPKSSAPRLMRFAVMPNRFIAEERAEQRQRNDRGREQRRAEIAQKEEQHGDDQQPALEQIPEDGARGARDHVALVVERPHPDAGREQPLDVGELLFDAPDDLPSVRALEHQHGGGERLPAAVPRHRAEAQIGSHAHPRHVAHAHRRRTPRGDHHAGNVRGVRHAAEATDVQTVTPVLDVAAAEVGVVAGDRLLEVFQAQLVTREPGRDRRAPRTAAACRPSCSRPRRPARSGATA